MGVALASYLRSEIWEEAFNTGFEELACMCKTDEINPEDLIGQTYTPRLGRCMPYGALINSKGVIVRVMTEKDYADL
jgi:hypothetical protein